MIAARLIIGLRSEVFKGDGDASEKRVQLGIPLIGIGCGDDRLGGWIFRLDAIDLLGIENGIALKKRHLTLAVLAALSTLVGVNLALVGIHDGRTLLALADASTKRKRLLEGQPMRRGIALGNGGNPNGQDVYPPQGNAGRGERDMERKGGGRGRGR